MVGEGCISGKGVKPMKILGTAQNLWPSHFPEQSSVTFDTPAVAI